MADLSLTAGSVLASSQDNVRKGVAGAAIAAGDVLYQDTDLSLKLADANGSAAAKVVKGIAVNSAGAGQPVDYCVEDASFTPGATLAVGTTYILSATAGKICPDADAATGMAKTVLGVATTTALLNFNPVAGGVVP